MPSSILRETYNTVCELGTLLVKAQKNGKVVRSRTHYDEFNEIVVKQREKTGQADADILFHAFKNSVAKAQKELSKSS